MTQTPAFQKNVEDFTCEHCGALVRGDGYTNHCPKCLWSKHVDMHPGDRSNPCHGMMEPVSIEGGPHEYRVVHRCQKCSAKKRNIIGPEDDMNIVIALAGKQHS
ncbi:MAG: hypothetical protein G01um10148_790 [Parcubacteria group bacterium Gr01-1014_8]|nr:MAG: hypothetical protein G01um10148_790 [Parcubacteria group bacterium Gr01-1014_8]